MSTVTRDSDREKYRSREGSHARAREDCLAATREAVAAQDKANRELPPDERKSTAGVDKYVGASAYYSDDAAKDVWPSNAELAERMGCCIRTVQRRRQRCEALGCGSHTRVKDGPRHNRTHRIHLRPTFGPALEYFTARQAQNRTKAERNREKAEGRSDRAWNRRQRGRGADVARGADVSRETRSGHDP